MKKIGSRVIVFNRKGVAKVLGLFIVIVIATFSLRPAVETVFSQNTPEPAKKELPIYSVETDKPVVSISFDAAWGADDTDELLRILEENDVKTTFFVCGYWVDKYPEEVKKIYEAGHDIGNHSNTHAHGAQLSLDQNKAEIKGTHDKIKELLGIDMNLYRPPYGEYNDVVLKAANELGYHTVQWDVDSHDWMKKGAEYQINQVLNNKALGNGSIVLFHNDAPYTPEALERTIKGLKEQGYEIIPISELIYTENYYMDHKGRQFPIS